MTATSIPPVRTMTPLEVELGDLDDRIRDAQEELREARATAETVLTRHLLGQPDGEALTTSRAIVASMSDGVNAMLSAREILLHKISRERD